VRKTHSFTSNKSKIPPPSAVASCVHLFRRRPPPPPPPLSTSGKGFAQVLGFFTTGASLKVSRVCVVSDLNPKP